MDAFTNATRSDSIAADGHDRTDQADGTMETYVQVSFSLAWLMLSLCILSALTNLVSACVYSRRCLRSPINTLLTGLSIIDLLLSIVWIPTFVLPCLHAYYRSSLLLKTAVSYSQAFLYPLAMICHCASVYTLVVIMIDRMISVLWPFRARWHSNRRAIYALLSVTIASVVYNCVRFFEFRVDSSSVELLPLLRDVDKYPLYMALYCTFLYFLIQFLIPALVLSLVSTFIIGSIYRAAAQRRILSNQQKREHRTALMLATTVILFLTCDTLPLILNAVELVNPEFFSDHSTLVTAYMLNDVCNVLIVFNTATTSAVYFAFCQRYRRVASQMFARLFKCNFGRAISITSVTSPRVAVGNHRSSISRGGCGGGGGVSKDRNETITIVPSTTGGQRTTTRNTTCGGYSDGNWATTIRAAEESALI